MVIIAEYFGSWHPTYKCVCADQLAAEVAGCMDTHNILTEEWESCVDTALDLWSLVWTVKMPTLLQHFPTDTEKWGYDLYLVMLREAGKGCVFAETRFIFKCLCNDSNTRPMQRLKQFVFLLWNQNEQYWKEKSRQAALTFPCFFFFLAFYSI